MINVAAYAILIIATSDGVTSQIIPTAGDCRQIAEQVVKLQYVGWAECIYVNREEGASK